MFNYLLCFVDIFSKYSPIDTNYVLLLVDFYLYSYEADFIQGLLKKNKMKLVRSFISPSPI